jgi:hypothetical protein
MIRDFTPILVGKVAPAPRCIPAPAPQSLEPAKALPDHAAMDDVASYAFEQLLLRTLTQLCFVIRTGGDVLAACDGAEKQIAIAMGETSRG